MRRVLIGDLLALAAAICGQPDGARRARRLCDEAHAAHAYTKRFDRLHPVWGNGSLMSRAFALGGRNQADWRGPGLEALTIACCAVLDWRQDRGLREGLDCRTPRLYARLCPKHEETGYGGKSAETEQH